MFNKTFGLSILLLSVFAFSGAALAADFSADVVTRAKGETFQSKMYFSKDKIRTEAENRGMKSISIVRLDKKVIWVIMPDQKMYMEMPLKEQETRGMTEKVAGETSRKKIGRETVNGIACDKYEVTHLNKSTGKQATIFQWLSDDKVPVKSAAVDGAWSTEMKNIRRAGQPASLFEVPAGYSRMDPGMGMSKGMGKMGRPSGQMPKMPVDYRKMMENMPGQ
jgi:hypothetical protein